mgnify:CR=1 FL=1
MTLQGFGFDGDRNVVRGDRLQQIGLIGLAPINGTPHVLSVHSDGVELSLNPDGPPLTDIKGQPRHYPLEKFRKIA